MPAPAAKNTKKKIITGFVRGVKQLFDSGYNGIKALFENKMYATSERMDYEKAAQYRDKQRSDRLDRSQKAVLPKKCDLDAVTLTLSQGMPCLFALPCARAGLYPYIPTNFLILRPRREAEAVPASTVREGGNTREIPAGRSVPFSGGGAGASAGFPGAP